MLVRFFIVFSRFNDILKPMQVKERYERYFGQSSTFFATIIRLALNALLVIITLALIVGVVKAGYDLATSLSRPLEEILQQMLLDIVFIVALVELTLTVLGYLKDGYVHVRYIIDTILIIMLNEVVTLWFKGASLHEAIGISLVLLVLAIVRITAVKVSPESSGNNKPALKSGG